MKKYLFIIIPTIVLILIILLVCIYPKLQTNPKQVTDEVINEQLDNRVENINNIVGEKVEEQKGVSENLIENTDEKEEIIENTKKEKDFPQTISKPSTTQKNDFKNEETKKVNKPQTEEAKTDIKNEAPKKTDSSKKEPEVKRCTNKDNHFIGVGNCGKWFNSKSEAIAEYEAKINYWSKKWEKFEIDDETYYKNCPTGYEIWDCIYCSKWTINYYYR